MSTLFQVDYELNKLVGCPENLTTIYNSVSGGKYLSLPKVNYKRTFVGMGTASSLEFA